MISAMIWRNRLTGVIVALSSVCTYYCLHQAPPGYSESATVVFTAAGHLVGGAGANFRDSLIATEVMMAQDLMSQTAQAQVRADGGGQDYRLSPFNLYDLQYPNYQVPVATLTVTAHTLSAAQLTFSVVVRILRHRLAALQSQVRVRAASRLHCYLAHDQVTILDAGSRVRVLAGLAVLAGVAFFMAAAFADRRRASPPPSGGRWRPLAGARSG